MRITPPETSDTGTVEEGPPADASEISLSAALE